MHLNHGKCSQGIGEEGEKMHRRTKWGYISGSITLTLNIFI